MNRKILSTLLVVTLLCSYTIALGISIRPVAAQHPTYTIVFTTGYGCGTKRLDNLTTWLEAKGHTVRVIDTINSTNLLGADALIFGAAYGDGIIGIEEFNTTNAPVLRSYIDTWFNGGSGKFLWVCGDGDYGGREWISDNSSAILETIGSHLRLERADVHDTWSYCAQDYRCACNTTWSDTPEAAFITSQMTPGLGALFHGATPVYAHNATGDYALNNDSVANVFPILSTSGGGQIIDNYILNPPVVHKDSYFGTYVVMAGEKNVGPHNNKVIATGASPHGDYEPIINDNYYDTPMNGSILVKYALYWGLGITPGDPSAPTLTVPATSTTDTFEATWTASTDPDGLIVNYEIEVSNESDFSNIVDSGTPTGTAYNVTGLDDGTYYTRVRAVCDEGIKSGWSSTGTTVVEIPTTPTPPIPGFPLAAVAAGAALALGVGLISRRRKPK